MSRSPVQETRQADPRPVSRPHDRDEREARLAAEVVAGGGSVAGWSFSSVSPSGPVQRQEVVKEKTDEEKEEAASKVVEALQETPQAKALKEKVLEEPRVKALKEAATSTPGLIVGGAALAGGVAALGAAKQPLPFQLPEVPLDKLTPGLSAKVKLEGPVNSPTFVGLTLTYKEQGPKGKKTTESDKIAADIARLRRERESLKPESQKQEEKRQEKELIDAWIRSQSGLPGLTIPLRGKPKAEEEPKKKEEQQMPVQPAPASPSAAMPATADVDDALTTPGRPLDPATRRVMETRFGYDFSGVRLHDDARAGATAADINAAAFTVGQDIVIGPGRYAPSTGRGRELLAHELAHTIQQRGARAVGPPIAPGSTLERRAAEAGRAAASGRPVTEALGRSGVAVAREMTSKFEPGGFTDEEIRRLESEGAADLPRAVAEAADTEAAYQALVPLRDERLIRSLNTKSKVARALMLLPMRALQILRRYGLDEPSSYWHIKSLHADLRRAIDRAMSARRGGAPFVAAPDPEAERREKLLALQGETYTSMTRSFGSAVGAGITAQFTDDPKKIAAGAGFGEFLLGLAEARGLESKKHPLRGSESPEVKGLGPFSNRYGVWSYSGPPRLEPSPAPRPSARTAPPAAPPPNVSTPEALAKTAPAKSASPEAMAKTLPDPLAKTVPAKPSGRRPAPGAPGGGEPPAPRGPVEVSPDDVRAAYRDNPYAVKKSLTSARHQSNWREHYPSRGDEPAPLAYRHPGGRVVVVDEERWPNVGKREEIFQPHELATPRGEAVLRAEAAAKHPWGQAKTLVDPKGKTLPDPGGIEARTKAPGAAEQPVGEPTQATAPRAGRGPGAPVPPEEVAAAHRANPSSVLKSWHPSWHVFMWSGVGGKGLPPRAFRVGKVIVVDPDFPL